jgi:hypothetical protein
MFSSIGWGLALPRRDRRSFLADINSANVSAGMTAVLFSAFGAIPVHLDVMASLGLSPQAAASWFFVTFMTSAPGSLDDDLSSLSSLSCPVECGHIWSQSDAQKERAVE